MTISTAISEGAVGRVVGIKTTFKDLRPAGAVQLPQRIAVIGQGASASTYATTKSQLSSAFAVGTAYGFGSPLHLAARQLFPSNGDGVGSIPVTFYPLEDDASGVAATGDITPSGAQTVAATYYVLVNNIRSAPFVISVGDTVATIVTAMTAAINAVVDMPVIAADNTTDVGLTSKWEGTSANDIVVEVSGSTTAGTSFAITQPSGGLVNPSVSAALAQMGDVWETLAINCLDVADTTTLDLYQTFAESRWGATTRKPLAFISGNMATTPAAAIAIPDARKTDYSNVQITAPGSTDLPLEVAARAVSRIAVLADTTPAHDYARQALTGITSGTDGEQWDYADREVAVLGGSSTTTVRDGVVNLADTLTFYHPTGDDTPAYRYLVDIVKLQNVLYAFDQEFDSAEWDGAPLVPDDEPVVEPTAKQPKQAVAAAAAVLDGLSANAVIVNVATAKASLQAGINAGNPKRLDLSVTVQLSGNVNIISVDLNFGFYFGA